MRITRAVTTSPGLGTTGSTPLRTTSRRGRCRTKGRMEAVMDVRLTCRHAAMHVHRLGANLQAEMQKLPG